MKSEAKTITDCNADFPHSYFSI